MKRRDSHVAGIAGKTVIDAIEMCVVEGQLGSVRYTVSLAIISGVGDVHSEGVVAGHMQKVAMRAIVHPCTINFVAYAVLKNDDLMAQSRHLCRASSKKSLFVSNKKTENFGSKLTTR